MLNTKIHYKSKNTIQLQPNNNYIPELLMAYSVVVDVEFFLEWCEYFGQLQVWYISCVPQLAVVHQ